MEVEEGILPYCPPSFSHNPPQNIFCLQIALSLISTKPEGRWSKLFSHNVFWWFGNHYLKGQWKQIQRELNICWKRKHLKGKEPGSGINLIALSNSQDCFCDSVILWDFGLKVVTMHFKRAALNFLGQDAGLTIKRMNAPRGCCSLF